MIFRIALSATLLSSQFLSVAQSSEPPSEPPSQPVTTSDEAIEMSELVPMIDVELGDRGTMNGLLTDRRGEPVGDMAVALRTAQGIVVPTTTNASGQFAYRGLVGGLYQLETEKSSTMCRVWAPGTAPPESPTSVLLVRSDDVAAGQWSPPGQTNNVVRGFKRVMANPIKASLIVGAAIAIPVAIHNANKDDNGS